MPTAVKVKFQKSRTKVKSEFIFLIFQVQIFNNIVLEFLMKKIFFLISLGLISNLAFAQQFELKYHHTALLVSDLDKSADFYGNVLQLEEIEVPYVNPVLRWFSLGEDLQLHLVKGNNDDVKLDKAIHMALNLSNFDAFVTYLEENKIPFSDWLGEAGKVALRGDGVKQVYLQDPDGHWIEINNAE